MLPELTCWGCGRATTSGVCMGPHTPAQLARNRARYVETQEPRGLTYNGNSGERRVSE